MNCEACCDLLLDYVEGAVEASIRSALEAHLEQCAACGAALEQTRALVGAMQDLRQREDHASSVSRGRIAGPSVTGLASWSAGARLGDFEILGELGRGGMGIVYRARQVSLNRLVALKVLPGVFRETPGAVARFHKEAQAAAKLHHTNIVPVYAQGEHDGHFYYAMELVEGDSLDRILRDDPARIVQHLTTRSPQDASSLGRTEFGRREGFCHLARRIAGVAEGLHHAHGQGVVHRDIKPQNLLLAPDGQLRITDFGLARLLDEPSITLTGEMVGTPAYMSPEQIRGKREAIDRRTDIYSLGVTFYEVLTGQRPFDGMSRDEVVMRILSREPKPPRKINSAIPLDLETICLRAMEKEPARRYATAADMATDLRRFADDRPIFSRRAGPVEKAVKWVRRHPALSTIYALLVVMTLGAAVWRVQTLRARQARADELIRQAYEKLAFEDYREPGAALDQLAEARRLGADDALYWRALALANLGANPASAARMLQNVLASNASDTESMYLLAWALRIRADRVDPAVREWLTRADALGGPQSAQAHFFRGQVLVREEDEAEKEYRLAKGLKPGYTQALLHLGRALNHWMYHHRSLEKFAELKDSLQAVCLVQDRKAYPRYLLSIGHRLAGEIHQADGKPDAAAAEFARALELAREAQRVEPDSARGYVAEAEYWETLREYDRSLALRNQSEPFCVLPEPRAELYQYRWRLHYWLGHTDAALADLEQIAALRNEADPRRVWFVGFFPALVMADQDRLDDAVAWATKSARDHPASFRAVTAASCFLRLMGRAHEADQLLEDYRDRVRFEPTGRSEAGAAFMRWCYRPPRLFGDIDSLPSSVEFPAGRRAGPALPGLLLACQRLAERDRTHAMKLLQQCDAAFDSEDYCYLARVLLRKMEADPAWPRWGR